MKARDFLGKVFTRMVVLNLLAMMLVVILLCLGALWGLDIYTHHGQAIVVPQLKGMSYEKALHLLESDGLCMVVSDSGYNKKLPANTILAQTPGYGQKVKEGHVIYVTVNSPNSPTFIIPDVIDNSSIREAEAKLNAIGFRLLPPQQVTGEKVVDYLTPRLFEPLYIDKPKWEESPQGINCGGWGLYLKTEDLAKMGQLLLQKGEWNGKQLIPAEWVAEMSKKQVESINPGTRIEQAAERGMTKETSDWMQGYGYQMWRCRPGCFRADGARGQYIIVVPDKNAVIAITSNVEDLQGELNLVWDNILPVL